MSPSCFTVFFNSLARFRYLSFFSISFSFILLSSGIAKYTILLVIFFFLDYYKAWSSRRDLVIHLYVENSEEFVRLILLDRFWIVHIPFVRVVKLKFLAQFPLDYYHYYYIRVCKCICMCGVVYRNHTHACMHIYMWYIYRVRHLPHLYPCIYILHAGHCWRSKDELISDILPWTSSQGRTKAGRPARIYIQHLCADTWYSLEDLPGAMDDRDG